MLAGFLSTLGWALAAQWGAVRPLLGQLSVPSLGAALAAVLGGIVATFLCWREVLADLGRRLPLAAGARVFFLGQLGKYLPGSLWPVMAQMELGRDHQVPERASGSAVGVFLLVLVGTGLVVAAAPLLHRRRPRPSSETAGMRTPALVLLPQHGLPLPASASQPM